MKLTILPTGESDLAGPRGADGERRGRKGRVELTMIVLPSPFNFSWDEETIRNDLPERYSAAGEWGGNFIHGAEEEKRCEE